MVPAQVFGVPALPRPFVLAVFAASASWQLLLAAGGSGLGRMLSSDRGRLVTSLVCSLVIVVLAVRTLKGLPGIGGG